MIKLLFTLLASILLWSSVAKAQESFQHKIELKAIEKNNLPGLHSYSFAQHEGLWLIIGGREDGIHARQPFASFASSANNTNIYVIDVENDEVWSSSVTGLNASLNEQLQSTNMNFIQVEDTLYIIGGYGYSSTDLDHKTHPFLTTVNVSGLINAVQQGQSITNYFKQLESEDFAVTGGQLGYVDGTFYLVGGHRFDGRYNPHGPNHGPGFEQEYTDAYYSFNINNAGSAPVVSNWNTTTSQAHLHRRDYNLIPQQYSNGFGYAISSGVFQIGVDEPFLYPVEITTGGYTPISTFNQYLSNYHSAHSSLYDADLDEHYHFFFGGISQYYYDGDEMIQDDAVPFVKTISMLKRSSDGSYTEYNLDIEMPGLQGASAEFIVNPNLPLVNDELIDFSNIAEDSILLGHVYGGINSPMRHAFSTNQTSSTSADEGVYEVWIYRDVPTGAKEINGQNPYSLNAYPNPTDGEIEIKLNRTHEHAYYMLANLQGQIVKQGRMNADGYLNLSSLEKGTYILTLTIDSRYFLNETIILK